MGEDSATKSANVVMLKFVREYKNRLIRLSLYENIVLLKIYVDDLNQAGFCLLLGTRCVRSKFYIPDLGWGGRAKLCEALSNEEVKN